MSGLVYYVLDATRLEQRVKIGHTTHLGERLTVVVGATHSGGVATPPALHQPVRPRGRAAAGIPKRAGTATDRRPLRAYLS